MLLCLSLSPEPQRGRWLRRGRALPLSPGEGGPFPSGLEKALVSPLPLRPSDLAVIPLVPSNPVTAVSPQALEGSLSPLPPCAFPSFQDEGKRPCPVPNRPLSLRPSEGQGHLLAPFLSNTEEGPLHSSLFSPPLCPVPLGTGKVHNLGSPPRSLQALEWLYITVPRAEG